MYCAVVYVPYLDFLRSHVAHGHPQEKEVEEAGGQHPDPPPCDESERGSATASFPCPEAASGSEGTCEPGNTSPRPSGNVHVTGTSKRFVVRGLRTGLHRAVVDV